MSNLDDAKLQDYLLGRDSSVWKDSKDDLVSLNPVYDFDHVTEWFIRYGLTWYHRFIGHRLKNTANADANLYHYNDAHLELPVHILSTTLASLLPILAIVILYLVKDTAKRLGLIAAFTAVFAVCLAVVTKARRVDVFSTTAA